MQKFDTTAPITTLLDVPAGQVRFIAADRTDATVEVLPADASKSRDVRAAEQITVTYADGVLHVQAPAAKQLLGRPGAVDVTVHLPAGSRVEAKAAAADLQGVGPLGDVTFEVARGSLHLTEAVHGTATLSTQHGDITVDTAPGTSAVLDAGTTLGRVHNGLRNTGTPELTIRATTTLGDITARSL